jgi:hypothetical protein
MAVKTDADEEIEKAQAALGEAINAVTRVVVERCPGWDAYPAGYQQTLRTVFLRLLEVRDLL